MTKMNSRDLADVRSEKVLASDAKKGNEAVRFAAFYREYVVDCGHTMATMAEVRAAYEGSK